MPSALGGIGVPLFTSGAGNSLSAIQTGLGGIKQTVQHQGDREEQRRENEKQRKFQDEQRRKQKRAQRRAFWTNLGVTAATGAITGGVAGAFAPAASASSVAGDAAGQAASAGTQAASTGVDAASKVAEGASDVASAAKPMTDITAAPGGQFVPENIASGINSVSTPTSANLPFGVNPTFDPKTVGGSTPDFNANMPDLTAYTKLPTRGENIARGIAAGFVGGLPGGQTAANSILSTSPAFNPNARFKAYQTMADLASTYGKLPYEIERLKQQGVAEGKRGGAYDALSKQRDARTANINQDTAGMVDLLPLQKQSEIEKANASAASARSRNEDANTKIARRPGQVAGDWAGAFQKGTGGVENLMQATNAGASAAHTMQDISQSGEMFPAKLDKAKSDAKRSQYGAESAKWKAENPPNAPTRNLTSDEINYQLGALDDELTALQQQHAGDMQDNPKAGGWFSSEPKQIQNPAIFEKEKNARIDAFLNTIGKQVTPVELERIRSLLTSGKWKYKVMPRKTFDE